MRSFLISPLAILLALAGCSGSTVDSPEPTDDEEEKVDPVAGPYRVVSHYNLSDSPTLPGIIRGALEPLNDLESSPSKAILGVLDGAGATVFSDLIDGLPGPLKDKLLSELDKVIKAQIAMNPEIAAVVMQVEDLTTMLTDLDVITTLGVTPADDSGLSKGNHTLAGISFAYGDGRVEVDTPELLNSATAARGVELSVMVDADGEGVIDISEHGFRMPLGPYAVTAVNMALEQTLGFQDLGEALASMIDCGAVAQKLSELCFGDFCVGNKLALELGCGQGLELLADHIESRIAEIDYAELHFSAGSAALHDANAKSDAIDGLVDSMDGSWESSLDVNGVVVEVPASFVAERVRQ